MDEKFFELENKEIEAFFSNNDKRIRDNRLLLRATEILRDGMLYFNNKSIKNITNIKKGVICRKKSPMGNLIKVLAEVICTKSIIGLNNSLTYKVSGILEFINNSVNRKKIYDTINLLNKLNIEKNRKNPTIYCVNDSFLEFSYIETIDPNKEGIVYSIATQLTEVSLQVFFIEAIVNRYSKKININDVIDKFIKNVPGSSFPLYNSWDITEIKNKNNARIYNIAIDPSGEDDVIEFENMYATIVFEDTEDRINNNKTFVYIDMRIDLGYTISYVDLAEIEDVLDRMGNELRKLLGFERSYNSVFLAVDFGKNNDRIKIESSLCFNNKKFDLEWIIKTYILVLKNAYCYIRGEIYDF